ncbi:MAG: hypothetical protein ACKVOA_05455 [Methylophilaceae bacterium]
MWSVSQRMFGGVAANAGHLILMVMAYMVQDPIISVGFLGLISALSFYGWIYNYKRALAIADIAPSTIGSAAQGYVELTGRSSIQKENLIVSPLSGMQCVWFRYVVYEKVDDNWRQVSENISPYTIQISDGTGTCQVDADNAEVIGATKQTSMDGRYKYEEFLLYGGSNLYVLGEFSTVGGAGSALNLKEDVNELLTEWKRDKVNLYKRFDLDKNGEIDAREWELARREAITEVQLQHREIRKSSGVNVVRAPHDKKLYLISTLSPQKLRSKFMLWTIFHILVVLVAATIGFSIWRNQHLHTLFS